MGSPESELLEDSLKNYLSIGIEKFLNSAGFIRKSEYPIEKRKGIPDISLYEQERGIELPATAEDYLKVYGRAVWVYSCVYAIASSGASLGFKLFKTKIVDGKKVRTQIYEGPAYDLLSKPNPRFSFYDLVEATYTYLELNGNNYWELERIKDRVVGIYPLLPHRMKIIPDRVDYLTGYIYTPNTQPVKLLPEDVIHIKYFNPLSEYYGLSPLQALEVTLITDFYAVAYNKNFFKNSSAPRGTIETDQSLSDAQYSRLKAEWESTHGGIGGAHKTALLEAGLKYKAVSLAPKEMEFIEQRKLSREEMLAAYGVPPVMVGLLEFASYANAKEQKQGFWQETMIPKLNKVKFSINNLLLPVVEKDTEMEFDLAEIRALQEDITQQATVYQGYTDRGIMKINEVREKLSLTPVPWGDTWYVPANLIPLELSKSENRDEIDWQLFVKRVIPFERSFYAAMKKYWKGQEERVILNLTSRVKKQEDVLRYVFDIDNENKLLGEALLPIYSDAIQKMASEVFKMFRLEITFNPDSKQVKALFQGLEKMRGDTNSESQMVLQKTLTEGLKAGESVQELMSRVREVYKQYSQTRAVNVARTEAIRAGNFGLFEGFSQSGVVKRKQWVSSMDNKVRDTHVIANGQAVPIEEPFIVGGVPMMYPGDPGAPAEEVCQCRCTMRGVVGV